MKLTARAIVLAVTVIAMLASTRAAHAGDQDFTLVNKTGYDIHQLYVSPSKADDWQEDILGASVLENDQALNIHFSPKERAKHWDLKIVDEDGNSIVWTHLNLLEISKVTLHYAKGGQPTADLE